MAASLGRISTTNSCYYPIVLTSYNERDGQDQKQGSSHTPAYEHWLSNMIEVGRTMN